MLNRVNKPHDKLLGDILKLSKDPSLDLFVHKMYSGIPYEDLSAFDAEYLFECAQSGLELLKHKGKRRSVVNYHRTKQEGEYAVLEVINDDVPFLVDSLCNELKLRQIDILLLCHNVLLVERDDNHNFQGIKSESGEKEYMIQIHIENHLTDAAVHELVEKVKDILECINFAVVDWRKMTQRMQAYCDYLKDAKMHDEEGLKSESVAFVEWLINNHFVFLGSAEMEFDHEGKIKVNHNSRLGIARSQKYVVKDDSFSYELQNNEMLVIRKWDKRSMVHRAAHLDTIIVKRYDAKNKCIGAALFFGLFTSTVYYQSVFNIPLMRQKVKKVIDRYGYSETSHNCKELATVLESFPRGELLQMTAEQLYLVSTGIVALTFTPRIKLFVRHDISSNFLSFLIFIPEKRFSTETRDLIENLICKYVEGTVSKRYVFFGESSLVRLQLVVQLGKNKLPGGYIQELEDKVVEALSVWEDELFKALNKAYSKKLAILYHNRYKDAFEQKYKALISGKKAVYDIAFVEEILKNGQVKFDVYLRSTEQVSHGNIHLKIYSVDNELAISSTLPLIENAGLYAIEMQTFRIDINVDGSKRNAYMQHYVLHPKTSDVQVSEFICQQLSEVLHKVWVGEIENDEYNSLIVSLQTDFRRANLFRAFVKYLKQTKYNLSTEFTHKVLVENSALTSKLLNYFETKFSLGADKSRDKSLKSLETEILEDLANIKGVSEDRALRSIFKLIQGILRTNFYQRNSKKEFKDYISFKIRSANVDVPQPVPYAEIFVHSPKFEAIHLRGGKVARGGLRWSDRREDFRTEVLGLMKAQMTKNSVIVPVGSKGGFALKRDFLPSQRQEMLQEGVECYKQFLSGILDITDNIVGGNVVPPKDTIRYDDDDPYLVVAADKGTATFSNYANEVSEQYGFWLGDAFASGGSAGYDHKKMGITAKGAWISVVRHFEEMGLDVHKDTFTATGIGDMSGDVFGNGMLLSSNMKLLAAFNHMHIFVDPDPDPKKSFNERQRLFEKPGSQWSDYNPKVISKGGAIFERSQKSVKLSPEVVKALGLNKSELSPDELIRGILQANVHLMWNGGIGTYVKAKHEENTKIGDKSNDNIRICGFELGAKVVGEGGNLGFTQLGRIEYARKGGRINTDFIDNSAGVDCSDHEVNINIALADQLRSGKLKRSDRDALLERMTDAVADLVLRDNFEQSQIITIEQQSKFNKINSHVWLINHLEDRNELDRDIEFLPARDDLKKLIQDGDRLTRPEIAVLLAYSKNSALKMVTNTSLADDKYLDNFLLSYFPSDLASKYDKILRKHILRKELIATVLVNLYVNTLGITSFHQILDESSIDPAEIIKAFVITYEVFGIEAIWKKIEELEAHVPATIAITMINKLQMLIERNISWLLYNQRNITDLSKVIEQYRSGMYFLRDNISKFMTDEVNAEIKEELERYAGYKSLTPLLHEVNTQRVLKTSFDIITVANKTKSDLIATAKAFYNIGETLSIRWLIGQARAFIPKQYFQIIALRSLITEIHTVQMQLTEMELKLGKSSSGKLMLLEGRGDKFAKLERYIDELKAGDASEAFISKTTIALKLIKEFLV